VPGALGGAAAARAAALAQRGAHGMRCSHGVERGGDRAASPAPADRRDGDVLGDVGGGLGVAEDREAVRRATRSARPADAARRRVSSGRLTASAPAWSMVVIAF
jgi:hypothetical protein